MIFTNLVIKNIRLIINFLSLYLLVSIPDGRRQIKKKFFIIFKIDLALSLLLSLTAVLPQSVLYLLKLPTIINLSCGNLIFASITTFKIYYIANYKAP